MADNIKEESLDNLPNTQPEKTSEENISTKDTSTINPKQETESMEVHHHSHSHGKKNWKSYIWEFLMLFLAVFCGFLAEYQLEHIVEQHREKQYIESMVHDIMEDTVKLRQGIEDNSKKIAGIDSLLNNIYSYPYIDSSLKTMYRLTNYLHYRKQVSFVKRTIIQLKNSGGLRLIRNINVSDSIVVYDQNCESIERQFDVAYWHQLKARDFEYKIYDPQCYLVDNKKYALLNNDHKLILEFASWVSMTERSHFFYTERLKDQMKRASRTIEYLKKEYKLE